MADLLGRLIEANVFKIGEFKLKSGALSPIYIDLRGIIAYPKLVGELAEAVHALQMDRGIEADVVCGVPYTALPIASVYSYLFDTRMVMKRKEAKDYGTKKMVEGVMEQGGSCLIIEDIVTSGSSVIETAEVLRKEGMTVTDCVIILDRQQGGELNLKNAGLRLHSLFTITDFFRRYCAVRDVEPDLVKCVESYLKDNNYIPPPKSLS